MILKLLFIPTISLVKWLIGLLPQFSVDSSLTGVVTFLGTAFHFFPVNVWKGLIGSIVFWIGAFFVKSIINFILGVLPFVNIRLG